MPAKSKQQQKFFGVVRAMQKGDIPKKGEAGEVADDMQKTDVKKMASTKHKGLPRKVKKESISITTLKEMVKEEFTKIIKEAKSVDKIKKDLIKTIDALKKNFPLYKAAKESGDEKKYDKYKKIALKLTKVKKNLETEMDKALGTLHADAELELEGKLKEAAYIDIEHALKTIKKYNATDHLYSTSESSALKFLAQDILKDLGFNTSPKNITAAADHLQNSAEEETRMIPEDPALVKELYPLMEGKLNEATALYKKGDEVQYQLDKGSPQALKPSSGKISKVQKVGNYYQYTIMDGGPVPVWEIEILGTSTFDKTKDSMDSFFKSGKYYKEDKVNESVMSDIDIIRQESESLEQFIRNFYQSYGDKLKPSTKVAKWLKGLWDMGQEVDRKPAMDKVFQEGKLTEAPLPKEKDLSIINAARAKAALRQIKTGKRDDGMGKFTARLFGVTPSGEVHQITDPKDLNMYKKFGLAESKLNEAPMDDRFMKEWEESTNAFINHIKHELSSAEGADKSVLKKMLQNLNTVAGYPKLMGRIVGLK